MIGCKKKLVDVEKCDLKAMSSFLFDMVLLESIFAILK